MKERRGISKVVTAFWAAKLIPDRAIIAMVGFCPDELLTGIRERFEETDSQTALLHVNM